MQSDDTHTYHTYRTQDNKIPEGIEVEIHHESANSLTPLIHTLSSVAASARVSFHLFFHFLFFTIIVLQIHKFVLIQTH
jgi:hypothetical protein